ncbi:MAG: DNA polymerase III subunit chi [Proteobacteria bacterium]|nr:DNA polymerase III subunit chi [Pseudomonadota bacterium]
MTEVSFHFNVPERTLYVCRLLRKATRQGAQVAVTAAAPVLDELDRVLWTFDPIEFLPHRLLRRAETLPARLAATPIVLTEQPATLARQDVLVNLGATPPEGFESYARLIEVVSNDEDDRAGARLRWKHYAARGYPIRRHEVVVE